MNNDAPIIESVAVDFDPFADQAASLIKSIPSTPAQQEMWSSIMMDPKASCAFNESFTLAFQGQLDSSAFGVALEQLISRHDALRACFSSDGLSLNIYQHLDTALNIETIHASQLTSIIQEETNTAFDLINGPLFRVRLLKESDTRHHFIFTAHHIICDGWSLGIVIADLSTLYNAAVMNTTADLDEPFSFVDYAEQGIVDKDEDKDDETYWLEKFSQHIPDYELVLDKDRPKQRSFSAKRLDVDVDLELINRIKKQAASMGCSLSAYTMAIYFIALQRWTGESSLVVGMPTAGQPGIAPYTLVGHCVTTVPIVSQLSDSISISEFVKQTSNEILDAFEHQNFTFGELIRQLAIPRDPSRIPLLPILFNFDAGVEDKHLDFHGLKTQFSSNPRFYENFEQFMNVADYGDHFTIECQYNTDLFDEASIRARIDEYVWLLTQSSVDATQLIGSLELSPINDYEHLLARGLGPNRHWQSEQADTPNSIAHYIHHQSQRFAEQPAVKFEQGCLSYQQLDALSAQWAHLLEHAGLKLGDRIGVCLDRSEQMLAALLGILKLGATYVPLDPDFPDDRLAYMIEDSGLQHLITQDAHKARLPEVAHLLNLDSLQDSLKNQATDYPVISIPGDTPAYIIYTSGSTGKPKGVVVPQSSVMNFLHSMAQKPGLSAQDTLMAVTTLSFDIAVLELYLPLWVGACLVIAKKQDSSDGRRLLNLLQTHQATCMQATPATWRLLISAGWQGEPRLKALCGGEVLPLDLASELLTRCDSLWNMYGPTETTVWSSCAHITQTDSLPGLGEPIANTQFYVLDEQQRPVPNGIAGELYIGGDGLSLGYNQRDELTQHVFIANPYGTGKLYRTGDKVRYTHDGKLLYMGRLDQQVKVRGYRIELGEIETLMRQHPAISDCALAVREIRAGDSRLIAYVIWQDQALSLPEMRQHLRQQLPPYMIPQHLETLTELPRTLNNKLDRKALQNMPFQEEDKPQTEQTDAASSATELSLLKIWQSVMGNKINSIKENFFDLGGHSLLIAQIIHRVEADLSVQLKFSDLYEFSTIESLALKIDKSQRLEHSIIMTRPENEPALLTLAQQRLWYLNQLEGSNTAFNLPSAFKFKGQLNKAALNQSFNDLVNRQEILRSEIIEINGIPQQQIHAPTTITLEDISLTHIKDKTQQEAELEHLLTGFQQQALDIHARELFLAKLITLNESECLFFFMPHHIIFDGWSFDIFIHELSTRYSYHCGNSSATLPKLLFQYADYAYWSRQADSIAEIEEDVQYWVDRLEGAPNLDMPLDFTRPEFQDISGDEVSLSIPEPLLNKLNSLALKEEATLFMVMMASYCALLAKYTEQDDLVIATPMADRTKPGTEELIGFFVNALALRFKIHKDMPFNELLHLVKQQCLEGFDHKDAPFEKIVERLNPERDMSRPPIYQTSITYQDVSKRELHMGDGECIVDIHQHEMSSHDSPLDLNIWFKKRHNSLSGGIIFSTSLFQRKTIEAFRDHYLKVLEAITANRLSPLSELTLLEANSDALLLQRSVGENHDWQSEQADAPNSIAHYIHHQSQRFAEQPAVKFEQSCLSYQQLDALSAQWAHLLEHAGLKLGDRIGVCLDRSEQMLSALLGILKLGATYVPLDPDFPDDRLSYMIEDSGLQHLITQDAHKARLPEVAHLLNLDSLQDSLKNQATDYPVISIPGETPAYIIYTSGSTGKPKGVVVPQSSVMNFLHSMAQKPGLSAQDTLMAVTTLSFDIAVLELYLPLWVGACLVIAKKQDSSDGRRLLNLLQTHQATCMQATPATWRLLISAGWQGEPRLKALCGGEALPLDLASELLSRCDSVWNMYGPTETTVWSSCAHITQTDSLPGLGEPIANTQFYVLDEQQRPVPNGIAGELYIGGDGLSLGYNQRDELTQQVFIADPYGSGKLYRTGDKVRYTHDGKLLYMGRLDQQVKVRGYRIELGEIETLMRQHPAISDCALAVREIRAGDSRLIAYVIWQDQALSLPEMRQHLRQQLPPYMIPQHLETLTELPRTLNNKLDRKALQTFPLSHASEQTEQQAPDTEKEIWLADLWKEIAGSKSVNKYDNFFDIGGHSLLSIQVIQRVMDTFHIELKPRDLLLETLHQLALKLEDKAQPTPHVDIPHEAVNLDPVSPFYFGENEAPLYGVIHEPAGGRYQNKAILFCSPVGHEYFRTYRMTQLLAGKLAKLGYYCMRFDYHGMGDASKEFNEVDMNTWQQDVALACEELKASSGCEQVVCIGSRLGAAIALSANASCFFSDFIFIDPIVDGQAYLTQLELLQKSVLSQNWHFSVRRRVSELQEREFLGYAYSAPLIQQLKNVSLRKQLTASETPITLISTEESGLSNLKGGPILSSTIIEDEGNWFFHRDIDRSISTHKINQFIIESLS